MDEAVRIKNGGIGAPGGKSSFGRSGGFDPEQFVKRVIARFEASATLRLDVTARARVISPAIEFRSQIINEIAMGTATLEKLDYAVTDLLRRAEHYAIAAGGTTIDELAILKAMEDDCHYLGWC
jgi:hypothetical protein